MFKSSKTKFFYRSLQKIESGNKMMCEFLALHYAKTLQDRAPIFCSNLVRLHLSEEWHGLTATNRPPSKPEATEGTTSDRGSCLIHASHQKTNRPPSKREATEETTSDRGSCLLHRHHITRSKTTNNSKTKLNGTVGPR